MSGYRQYGVVLLVTAVFCLISALWIDQPLALYLKADVSENILSFFKLVTEIGRAEYLCGIALVVGAIFLVLYFRRQGGRDFSLRVVRTVVFMIVAEGVSAAVIHILKFSVGRYRPRMLFREELYGFSPFSGGDSFPSGHTQSIVAALLPIALCWPVLRLPVFFVIGMVAFSRVIITAHYLSDVVASMVITSLCVLWLRNQFLARGWLDGRPGVARRGFLD